MAIEVKFLANLVSFLRGTRDMATHLDQVGDSLDDLVDAAAQAGDQAGAQLGDGLDTAARAARDLGQAGDRAGDQVADGMRDGVRSTRDLTQAFDRLEAEAARASKGAGDGLRRGVGDGLDGIKEEASQSARETAASFRGEMTDLGQVVQDTLANGMVGLGPIGLAAGLGVAAAFGTGMANMEADTERAEQRVSDMYQAMLEAGNRYRTEEQLQSATKALADNADQWALALERQAASGVEIGTVLRAMVGDADAVAIVRQGLVRSAEAEVEAIKAGADSEQIKADRIDAVNTKLAASTEWLDQIIGDTDTAAAKAAAVASSWESVNTRAQALRDTVAEVVRDLDRVGKGVDIPIRADTTGLEGALAGMQGRTITVNVNGQITRIGNQVW